MVGTSKYCQYVSEELIKAFYGSEIKQVKNIIIMTNDTLLGFHYDESQKSSN